MPPLRCLLLPLLVGACAVPPEHQPELFRPIPLPDGPAQTSVESGPDGTLWVGGDTRIVVLDRHGDVAAHLQVPDGGGAWRLLGWTEQEVVLRSPDQRVAIMSRPGGPIRALYRPTGADRIVLADPEWVYEILPNSAVYGVDPATGQVRWAWPRRGRTTGAAMLAPEGDRMYQALADEDGEGGTLLLRDLETGRTVGQAPIEGRPVAIDAGVIGGLYVASIRGGGVALTRYRPMPGETRAEWTTMLGLGARDGGPGIAISPMRDQLVVWTGRAAVFVDPGTGAVIGRLSAGLDDAAYDPRGRLHLLRDGALLRWMGSPVLEDP